MRGLWFVALLGCNPQGTVAPGSPWESADFARGGQADTALDTADSGLDLTPTMDDMCPADPNKTEAGFCGCSWIDLDIDGAGGPETCVHATANVDGNATIGLGAIIANNTQIGDASIGAGTRIGARATIGDGSSIGADSIMGRSSSIGLNSTVGPESTLGRSASIGDNVDASAGYLTLGYATELGSDSLVTGPNVILGNLSRVGTDVTLHENVVLARSVVVENGAEIGESTVIGPEALVGANTVIGESVRIRKRTEIGANSTVGDDSRIGRDSLLESNVTLPVDSVLRSNVFVGANNVLTGDVYLPRGTRIEGVEDGIDALPIVTIASPTNGVDVSGGSLLLSGTATDDRGVASLTVRFNDGVAVDLPLSGSSFSETVTVPDNTQTIRVTATDTAGQIGSDIVFVNDCLPSVTSPFVWTGNVSDDWSDGANWSDAMAPTSTSDVFICGTVLPQPTLSADSDVRNLSMSGTAQLHTNGRRLTAFGSVIAGVIDGTGTLEMPNSSGLRGVVPRLDVRGNVTLTGYLRTTGAVTLLAGDSLNVNSRTFESDGTYTQTISSGSNGLRLSAGGLALFNGNATFNGTTSMSTSNLTAGDLRFRRNLTVQDTTNQVFRPSSTRPIVFDGTTNQTIRMRGNTLASRRLEDIVIANQNTVFVDGATNIQVVGTATVLDGATLNVPTGSFFDDIDIQGTGAITSTTLDMYRELAMSDDATLTVTTLNTHTRLPTPQGAFNVSFLDVVGNVFLTDDWAHTVSNLRVQPGGNLRTNNNNFTLNGTFTQNINSSNGGLVLSTDDVATFNGNATFNGTTSMSTSNLGAGVLRFRGNMTVQNTSTNVFRADTATVYIDGTTNQTLNLGRGTSSNTNLGTVFVAGTGSKGFRTASSQAMRMTQLTVSGTADLQRDTTITGDLLVDNTGTLTFASNDLTVNGTCTVNGSAPANTCD